MRIAIDFDGTIVEHMYPEIGRAVPHALDVIRELKAAGHFVMLWTMRSGEGLDQAVAWLQSQRIVMDAVNTSPPDWSTSPKLYAQLYIDDAALGCPLRYGIQGDRDMVNWWVVRAMLVQQGILPPQPRRDANTKVA
jgi:hypothetical protein